MALAAGLAALVTVSLSRKPAHVDPNGGWPAMRDAGAQVVATVGRDPIGLHGLPVFKNADAIRFPIEHAGGSVDPGDGHFVATTIVVACDRLFEAAIGNPCGGAAEDALLQERFGATGTALPALITRFAASPRTWISIYGPPVVP